MDWTGTRQLLMLTLRVTMTLVMACWPLLSLSQTRSTQGITPEFRKQAWRALDAIDRYDVGLARNRRAALNENALIDQLRLLDAEKASAETNYAASNEIERHYAEVLGWAVTWRANMTGWVTTSDEWQQSASLALQCDDEAKAVITPTALTQAGNNAAAKQSCIAGSQVESSKEEAKLGTVSSNQKLSPEATFFLLLLQHQQKW